MRVKEIYIVIVTLIISLIVFSTTSFTPIETLIVWYQLFIMLRLINNLGYTVCFFDFLCFYSAFDTLLMSMIGYRIYNKNDFSARLWGWYMRVPEEEYYAFLIPANLALFIGCNLALVRIKSDFYKQLITRLALYVKDKGRLGIWLTVTGFAFSFLALSKSSFTYVFYLLSMFKYVGPVYIYFSNMRFSRQILILSVFFFLAQSVAQGMFGEFIMYETLLLIILSLKWRLNFFKKLGLFVVSVFLIFTIQSIKGTYRKMTWGQSETAISANGSSKMEIFSSLFTDQLASPTEIFDKRSFFTIYVRMNQGQLVSRAMNYIPRVEPYAEGETILRSLGAVLVPRFLWPDKPESGGAENLSRFVGIKRKLTYSMNIGPYGEAYGNFGPVWGIGFMLVYGLVLSLLLRFVVMKSIQRPTLLLWSPILFFSTLTVETDILSTLNSFFKAVLFLWFLFWFFKKAFNINF